MPEHQSLLLVVLVLALFGQTKMFYLSNRNPHNGFLDRCSSFHVEFANFCELKVNIITIKGLISPFKKPYVSVLKKTSVHLCLVLSQFLLVKLQWWINIEGVVLQCFEVFMNHQFHTFTKKQRSFWPLFPSSDSEYLYLRHNFNYICFLLKP